MSQSITAVETPTMFREMRLTSDRVALRKQHIPEEFLPMLGGVVEDVGIGWFFKSFHVYSLDTYNDLSVDTTLRRAMERTGKLPVHVLDHLPIEVVASELPHVDPKEPAMILYLAKPEHLMQERWTKTRAGRYLRRHMQGADDETIKQRVATLRGEYTQYDFKITDAGDADAVEYVYVNGPDSCMSGKGRHRQGEIRVDGEMFHPMRVMAHPDNDLRLAYMLNSDGVVLARSWVNVRRMTHCSVYSKSDAYGNAGEAFEAKLRHAGYSEAPRKTMIGQIIHRIETDCGAIVCPYIDPQNMGVQLYKDYMEIDGPYEANYETGCLSDYDLDEDCHSSCCECGDRYHEDDLTYVESADSYVCNYCLENDFTYAIVGWSRGSWDLDWVRNHRVEDVAVGADLPSLYVHENLVGDHFSLITAGRNEGRVAEMDDCVYCESTNECWYVKDLDHAGKAYCGDCYVVYDADDGCPNCGDY